uniref:MIP-T3 domain-containing protein n=2 Tax=Caenorhabditis tropicalis TaxID=1561998 RepID=A0A1I7UB94_9PELO
MMMRKNIELQLQALQMIEFMCGLIPSVLQLEDGETLKNMKKLTPEETERYVLISVLRHSKDEYDAMNKSEEMEQMARNSRIQREALEQEIRNEEMLLQRALDEGMKTQNRGASTQTDASGSLRSVAAIMAATFSIDTATATDDIKFELLDEETKKSSSKAMTSTSTGTDAVDTRESRPKSAKRVGSAVGKRSGSGVKTSETGIGPDDVDFEKKRPSTSSRKNSESNTERPGTSSKASKASMGTQSEGNSEEPKRPGSGSKASKSSMGTQSEGNPEDTRRPGTGSKASKSSMGTQSEGNTEEEKFVRPGTSSKKSSAIQMTSDASPEGENEKPKRPGTAKGPNERKYSKAGLEDLVGPKNGSEETKTETKSRPTTRKSSRTGEESTSRPPSRKTTTSHESRAKTPSQKANNDDRPTTRRSSVDKNAPKRNDSVPRERRPSVSHEDRKPPKPIGGLKSNKYDGEVVLGRPESPGMDHGPRRKNLNDVNSQLVDSNRLNSSDVRNRAQYLREQRDKLLQMKNEERIKQMNDIQRNSVERPKTAARAREVLDNKDKKEKIRKEISDKLKTQILTLH